MKGKLLFNFEISEEAKYTIWVLMNHNPEKRPTSDKVLELPFFKDIEDVADIKKSIQVGKVKNVAQQNDNL